MRELFLRLIEKAKELDIGLLASILFFIFLSGLSLNIESDLGKIILWLAFGIFVVILFDMYSKRKRQNDEIPTDSEGPPTHNSRSSPFFVIPSPSNSPSLRSGRPRRCSGRPTHPYPGL